MIGQWETEKRPPAILENSRREAASVGAAMPLTAARSPKRTGTPSRLRGTTITSPSFITGVKQTSPVQSKSTRMTRSGHHAGVVRVTGFMECASRRQSIFSPSALTTGVQRATSAARDRLNFSGFKQRAGSIPASISICLTAGSATACAFLRNLFDDPQSASRSAQAAQWSLSRSSQGNPVRPPSEAQAQRRDVWDSSRQKSASCRTDGIRSPARSRLAYPSELVRPLCL